MADFFHAMGVLCSRDLLQCGILPLMKEQTPQKVQFVTVDADVAGQRIDNFLRTQLKGVPKSMIYRILRKGEVRVNKGRIKPEYKLADGDVVRIFNNRGAILAGAVLTANVRPSVIEISTGAWYDPLEPGTIGSLDRHGNPNVLTFDKGTSRLAQGPTAHSTLVEMEKFASIAPEVSVFTQPPTC